LSWIIRDLWSSLEKNRANYASLLDHDRPRAVGAINRIADEVGQRYSILLQLNFPPGQYGPRLQDLGHRDLSIVVHRGREKFSHVSEQDVKKVFEQLNPVGFEQMKRDRDGFRARLAGGRIDCLPSGVHLWCDITPEVLAVVDWLFLNAYGMKRR
jgi:hypothetical protein